MSRLRIYIRPRLDTGVLSPDFIEVTDDVDFNSTAKIKQQIDNDEFNVGQFKFNDFNLKLNNKLGKYSDVNVVQSIFRFRRSGSIVKLTWSPASFAPECGIATAGASTGATLNVEKDLFYGILSDEASRLDLTDSQVSFRVLSTDGIFENIEADFSVFSVGQLVSDAIFAVLNRPEITEYLTLDIANIDLSLDLELDDIEAFENATVKECLDDLLLIANSVIYTEDEIIFIKPREGGSEIKYTFIGQASNNGTEDIVKITDVATGLNRVFNFWTWKDTNLVAQDTISVAINQVRKKEFESDLITDNTKRQQILDSQRTEFKDKKQRLKITSKLNLELLEISLLDQVRIDYPSLIIPAENDEELPIYGIARYDISRYGFQQSTLIIKPDVPYKVMGVDVDTKKQQVTFNVEEQ